MGNFRELKVWQKSIVLVTDLYKVVGKFPKEEIFGLSSQIKRAAVSVSSNIAEGSSFRTSKEFNHYLKIALGSLYELETQITISKNLNFIDETTYIKLIEQIVEIQKMTTSLKSKIQ